MGDSKAQWLGIWLLLFLVGAALRLFAFEQGGFFWGIPADVMLLAVGVLTSDAAGVIRTSGYRPVPVDTLSSDETWVKLSYRFERGSGPSNALVWAWASLIVYVMTLILSLAAQEIHMQRQEWSWGAALLLVGASIGPLIFILRSSSVVLRGRASVDDSASTAATGTSQGGV